MSRSHLFLILTSFAGLSSSTSIRLPTPPLPRLHVLLHSMLPSALWSCLFLLVFSSIVGAQGPIQTFFPAAVPLAVKTPYMSVWYESMKNSTPLSYSWPLFWNLDSGLPLGWLGMIRVNGTTYRWMGYYNIGAIANVTNFQVTPTQSIFVMRAGPMNVTVTFLSPVEPEDWVKQSIPFSYVSVEAQSLDGNSYPVQVYSDISAEWASGDRPDSQVQWSKANTGKSLYHKIKLQNPQNNQENHDQAQDGTVYYAISTTSQSRITWQIDVDANARNGFQSNGVLKNVQSTTSSNIGSPFPVCALAVDLGTIKSTAPPVTWSIGYVRDPSITYTTNTGATQQQRPYYVTQYSNIESAIDAFTGDYSGAQNRAVTLDQKITSAATKISSQYSDIVSLATRQTFGALDITVGTDSKNDLVPGDIKIFMKNLGTDRRVNPVEHIYAAFPMFMYLNASLGGALLQPLLELQASRSGQAFAAQDIGNNYPTVSGPSANPQQGVEQSGNMLIMELAHARMSGNGTLLLQYYDLTKQWANYLINNAAKPKTQTNQDGESSGSANIALKGIIGVKAMAEIAHAVGEDSDATQYANQASVLLDSWMSQAMSPDRSHLLGIYGNNDSWSLMYNLFADKMLGLDFMSQSVIDMQTQYLSSELSTSPKWGLPIGSSTEPWGNAAWTLFASAFASDTTVRDNLIKSVYNHANFNETAGAFPEMYNITNNAAKSSYASPALGGLFSHLVLTVPNKTISADSTGGSGDQRSGGSSSNVGAIVGGVVGGLAIVGIVVGIFFVILRKRRRQKREEAEKVQVIEPLDAPHHPGLASLNQDSAPGFVDGSCGAEDGSNSRPAHPHEDATTASQGTRANDSAGARRGTNMARASDARGGAAIPLSSNQFSKRRGVPPNRTQRDTPSETAAAVSSLNIGSQAGLVSGRDPLSLEGPHSAVSSTDMAGFRTEVENLRRVVQEIRAERLEPPPEYVE